MHNEHVPFLTLWIPALRRLVMEYLDVPGAASPRHHLGVQAVGQIENVLLALQQGLPGAWHVGNVNHLHLADEHRVGDLGAVAARQPGGPRRT